MQSKDKELLEYSDLLNLHKKFGDVSSDDGEVLLPEMDIPARADVWTEIIHAIDNGDQAALREMHARVQHEGLSPDGKAWWEVMLAVAMNAPVYELERLHKVYPEPAQTPVAAYLYMAAGELAGKAAQRERKKRRAAEMVEQEKLKDLRQIVDERQAEKNVAEQRLNQHTRN